MHLHKILPYSILASMSTSYNPLRNLQEPLIQSPSDQASSSRRIVLRSSSNSISGSYPLYDLLSITTQSGSISVSVTPHSASSEEPSEPARLELTSNSGSVRARLSAAPFEHPVEVNGAPSSDQPPSYSSLFDADDDVKAAGRGSTLKQHCKDNPSNAATQSGVPDREYLTSVSTQSGTISGTFPLGTRTVLDSHSGSLNGVELVVMPVKGSEARRLSTLSPSGSQKVRITEDYFWAGQKEAWWQGMESRHESRSGAINVAYPDSWEGMIEVETGSGSISVTGRGVEIIREGRGRVLAQKGEKGGGKVIVRAASGSVNLRFG